MFLRQPNPPWLLIFHNTLLTMNPLDAQRYDPSRRGAVSL